MAMGHSDRQPAAGHAGEEQRRALQHLDQTQPGLELLALVAGEARPGLGAGDDGGEGGHHLAAVAHAQGQGVGPLEEGGELLGQRRVEQDAAGPALAGAQGVAVAEAAAGHQGLELVQPRPARLQVGHVHIEGLESGLGHGVAHLDMRVDALLAQDGHLRLRQLQKRRGRVGGHIERRKDR